MEEELLQLRADNARLVSKVQHLEAFLEEYEEAYNNQKSAQSGPSNNEVNLQRNVDELRKVIQEQNTDMDVLSTKNASLEKNVSELNTELNGLKSYRPMSPVTDRTEELEEVIRTLEEKNSSLEAYVHNAEVESRSVLESLALLEREKKELEERVEEMMHDSAGQRQAITKLREEKQELEIRLSEASTTGHATKGNSMFGEFFDERKKLEKDLRTVHTEVVQLRRKNRVLRQEIDDEKMRSRLHTTVQEVKKHCRCGPLQVELSNARSKVEKLEKQIASMSADLLNGLGSTVRMNETFLFIRAENERLSSAYEKLRPERDRAVDDYQIALIKIDRLEKREKHLETKVDTLESMVISYRERLEEAMNGGVDTVSSSKKNGDVSIGGSTSHSEEMLLDGIQENSKDMSLTTVSSTTTTVPPLLSGKLNAALLPPPQPLCTPARTLVRREDVVDQTPRGPTVEVSNSSFFSTPLNVDREAERQKRTEGEMRLKEQARLHKERLMARSRSVTKVPPVVTASTPQQTTVTVTEADGSVRKFKRAEPTIKNLPRFNTIKLKGFSDNRTELKTGTKRQSPVKNTGDDEPVAKMPKMKEEDEENAPLPPLE